MRWIAMLVTVVLGALGAGCSTNAATGHSQFDSLSRDEEIAMGTEASPQMLQEFGGKVEDAQLQAYVTRIGRDLASKTEGDNPTLPWEFTLLNSDVINAFALPGGKVFVTRGLASKMDNEAQLAGVLGHEVGHVTAQHTDDRITRQMGMGVAASIAGILVGAATDNEAIAATAPVAFNMGGQLILLKYDRGQELEADALGMRYMSRLGYDPAGQRQVMEILEREAKGGREPELFATHPHPESRIRQIDDLLTTTYSSTQGNPAFHLYPERFRSEFLARLPKQHASGGSAGGSGWCGVCAAGAVASR